MTQSFKDYLFEYHHDGLTWGITIPATSEEDARARLKKLPLARFIGIKIMSIPVPTWFGGRVVTWAWLTFSRVFGKSQ
jgi:hypothetical protein